MVRFSEATVAQVFRVNLDNAIAALCTLPFADGMPPTCQGLSGWVFEATIRACLAEELAGVVEDFPLHVRPQVTLKGRAKADLVVGRTVIELKAGGLFGPPNKYLEYVEYARKIPKSG